MVKHLLLDIEEEDFRKLNLKCYRHVITGGRSIMQEIDLNDLLDNGINYALRNGYESDRTDLTLPVTIAIHEENNDNYSGYLDKFMNRFTGLQTFQIGWGIKHLYSTRDYYEDHEDYWRVRKAETSVIYRVHLNPKWLKKFVLKHKTEITERISNDEWIETNFILDETTGEWTKQYSSHVIKKGKCTSILPVKD